jgi:predicted Zn-dependent peptidase
MKPSAPQFLQHTLPNGLTVIGELRPSAVSVAMGFFVRSGARDETPEVSGVSHFLEHMLFKGTATRSALQLTYDLAAIGAQANAYTSEENTVYYMGILPEYYRQAFDILSDMMRPALDETDFTTEKKVILEEIEMYKDIPVRVLFESALQEYFHDHPAGNSVLGTTESITALTVEQMRDYYQNRYSAKNTVFVVSGKFDWSEVIDLVEERFSNWREHPVGRSHPTHAPTKREFVLKKPDLQGAHIIMLTESPSSTDNRRYEADVLTCILGDSSGSRTHWEILDKGLAESASIDSEEMDGVGFISAYAACSPERLPEVEARLLEILNTPKKFNDSDLERALTKLRTRHVLQGESSMRRLMVVGNDYIYRKQYLSLEEELNNLRNVTRESIESLLEEYSLKPKTIARLLPA